MLSFGLEAMISVPIVVIMVQATTAARVGRGVNRTRIVIFEASLLAVTVALNTAPHLAAHQWARAGEYAVAPTMVAVLIWLHAWTAARYGELIAAVAPPHDEDHHDDPGPVSSGSAVSNPVAARAGTAALDDRTSAITPVPHTRVDGQPRARPDPGVARGPIPAADDCGAVAEEMVLRRWSLKSPAQIAEILRLASDPAMTGNAIATRLTITTGAGWPHATVDRILRRAAQIRALPPDQRITTTTSHAA